MTTEDDFQTMLDAKPDDHATRLVFADWLQEREDVRAEGYRALVHFDLNPVYAVSNEGYTYFSRPQDYVPARNNLPVDWFTFVEGGRCLSNQGTPSDNRHSWVDFDSRREGEDAVARAFSKLPPERRQQLLNQES